ncbi:MAG: carbamoylphosphate synthase large subunit [Bacillota bacterium]|nr:carbamoylphosphate synthase large subunit [Bacillota bacterium]
MNVIFISPNYPRHFYQFCERLKVRGVNVLGIGDQPWEELSDPCKHAISDYRYVSSLSDYDAVYRTVASFIAKYGRIDYIESQNEYWLETDARIRTDFNICSGPKLDALRLMNRKSEMKKVYERAGIPVARWLLPDNLEEAVAFAKDVGYPIIMKPDHGMGASDTHKIHNEKELVSFWSSKVVDVIYIEEECVPGHVETFDGITDSHREVLFAASQVLPKSLMDAAHGDDIVSYCQQVPKDLYQMGARLLKEYDTRNRFFHFEFFCLDEDKEGLGKVGDIVGLEVNMRAPGGRIPDKMNYAFNTDVYTIWADSLIHDKCFINHQFKYYITHIGRRHAISYLHSDEEILKEMDGQIIEDFEVDKVLALNMGDHAFLLRADSKKAWEHQMNYVLERNK